MKAKLVCLLLLITATGCSSEHELVNAAYRAEI